MTVKALYDYDWPSQDRQENFGDDILVHVMWTNNLLFCAAACFRAPKAMRWSQFRAQMVDPWASSDPGYDPAAPTDWQVDGGGVVGNSAIDTGADPTLQDTGVGHKGLITFRT